MLDSICPCNSKKDYQLCCGMYHLGHATATTPEALMRSRYSAYVLSNIAYIKATMHGKPLLNFDITEAEQWCKSVAWLGLKILNNYSTSSNVGYVEFIATYLENDIVKTIHETSEFLYTEHRWYYVDGKQIATPSIKVARNSLCPCGSSKKFKHCHAVK